MINFMDFTHRPILVTGANGNIGAATVRLLKQHGADVIAAGPSDELLAPVVDETGVRGLAFDLAAENEVCRALSDLPLYGVVNCAGLGGVVGPLQDADVDVYDSVMAVNARGAFLVTKYAARTMIAAGRGGSIVNVSSQAAVVALTGHMAYGASKAALDSMTRVAALELGPHNIRVNSVNPTVVMTPMSASYWGRPEIKDPFLAQMPLGRYATEEEIAAPIAFLLSDAASMITGVTLPIDGGYTAR
ncbi:SDR family oxidoreductase [Paractinoplanes lichenicola]|uniref:SDR family oxidoreductase n=1 Tax=Paractinoplanes lichenicola TaxID=2802976 RepID=A0ABS1W320_9ACTN|nr:SDR family oxidoreductase [Actinoplanes lichenicola]MBL7261136.1 SDR family oxidoreductase [Actinoplanes lichenicola]